MMDYEQIETIESKTPTEIVEDNPSIDWKAAGTNALALIGGAVAVGYIADLAYVSYEDSYRAKLGDTSGETGIVNPEIEMKVATLQRNVGIAEIVGAAGIQIAKLYFMHKKELGFMGKVLDGATCGLAVAGIGNVLEGQDSIKEWTV